MEVNMSVDEVKKAIRRLENSGTPLKKKKVKKSHPELMRHALYYYPSWDDALDAVE